MLPKGKSLFLLLLFLLTASAGITAQSAEPESIPETDPSAAAESVTAEEILSEHSVYGDPEKSGDSGKPVIIDRLCNFDQRNARNLYKNSLEDPDALTAGEKQIVKNIVSLLEQYGVTDEEQRDYLLTVAAASGCGYAMPVEILLDRYLNDPEGFEKKYGYPLYYVNDGEVEYNLDTIFTDFFLKTNSEKIQKIVTEKDSVVRLLTAFGMSLYHTDVGFDEMDDLIQTVFGPETEVALVRRDLSVKTYNKYMLQDKYDYACIAAHTYKLKPYGTNPYDEDVESRESGHWMRVKGTVGKKHYLVSSWGEEWELYQYSPFFEEKILFIFQPKSESDGGFIFIDLDED